MKHSTVRPRRGLSVAAWLASILTGSIVGLACAATDPSPRTTTPVAGELAGAAKSVVAEPSAAAKSSTGAHVEDAKPTTSERAAATAPTFANAILISVDGLRADALLAVPPSVLPNFARLRRGASTLNARTDPDWTITLPNHTAMITGRFVEGANGHNWTKNDDADPGDTLAKKKKSYLAGVFDVAHDRGFQTALFAGKTKFSIYDVSWNADNGAPDTTDADDGRDKLDSFVFELDTPKMIDAVLAAMATDSPKRRLYFVHFAVTDLTGHAFGWDVTPGSRYMKAVMTVDEQLGRILDAIEAAPAWKGRTAVVLTADHGGGAPFKSHDQKQMWVDYVIPFVVWTGGGEPRDLYALNAATRADPGIAQPSRDLTGPPPIRNGDAGNLALELLGLPAIPGSTIGARQDLVVRDAAGATPH